MEEFRDLDDYYLVSNEGRVYSKRSGKILKTHPSSKNKGYVSITLNYKGVKKTYLLHRLVAKLFLPNPHNYPCIHHIDGNHSNNKVDNLEWCDYYYNLSYGIRLNEELHNRIIKGSSNAPKRVVQMDLNGNVIKEFFSASEASRALNIPHSSIIRCCNQRVEKHSDGHSYTRRTAGGFRFSWLNSN